MPSILRSVVVAVPSSLLVALFLVPLGSVAVMASPSPLPMPLTADYSNHFIPTTQMTNGDSREKKSTGTKSHDHHRDSPSTKPAIRLQSTPTVVSDSVLRATPAVKHAAYSYSASSNSARVVRRQGIADLDAYLSLLSTHRDDVVSKSQSLKSLAAQSASTGNNNAAYQQQCASGLTSFYTAFQSFGNVYAQLGADKGLANYDKSDQFETCLKDVVNANKNTLSATDVIAYNDPTLGPVLGPIVYEIKCIIDDILNITENLVDGTLNALNPLLGNLLGQANSCLCGTNFKLAGFCL